MPRLRAAVRYEGCWRCLAVTKMTENQIVIIDSSWRFNLVIDFHNDLPTLILRVQMACTSRPPSIYATENRDKLMPGRIIKRM